MNLKKTIHYEKMKQEEKDKIEEVASLMRFFQNKKKIKNQCITNAQYLYDVARKSFPHLDTKVRSKVVVAEEVYMNNLPGIVVLPVVSTQNIDTAVIGTAVISHMVVVVDGHIFDASHDVFSLKKKTYVDEYDYHSEKWDEIRHNFKKYENDMNNGILLVTDTSHYNDQADWVELWFLFNRGT